MTKKSCASIANSLATIREQRGVSASALAAQVGVSRQTIYAMEKGDYVPNTLIGLRLARTLGVRVEDLFSLSEPEPIESKSSKAKLLPGTEPMQPGQPVSLCEIDGQIIAAPSAPTPSFFPPSDGILRRQPSSRGQATVDLYDASSDFSNRLLLAGCDPAMATISRHLQSANVDVVLLHQNSSQALSLLKDGLVHIAGTHLHDEATGEANLSAVHQLFPHGSVAAISFACWEEGLVVASGNPKQIGGIADLSRKEIQFVNREPGAGSRLILDRELARLSLSSKRISGYDRLAFGHLAAAWEIKADRAHCCLANQSVARVLGLQFLPLKTSRYDLICHRRHLSLNAVQILFSTLNRSSFRTELRSVGGYDTDVTGSQVL